MELYEIVMKLVGPVQPTGEHEVDQIGLANIKQLTELIDRLLYEINRAEPSADRNEASMKAIGLHAREFIKNIREA